MKLGAWMEANGLDDAEMGRLSRLDGSTISRLRRGRTRPSWEHTTVLDVITSHQVSAADWLPPAPSWARPYRPRRAA